MEYGYLVTQSEGLVVVVGYVDDSYSGFAQDLPNIEHEALTEFAI